MTVDSTQMRYRVRVEEYATCVAGSHGVMTDSTTIVTVGHSNLFTPFKHQQQQTIRIVGLGLNLLKRTID